MPRGAIHIDEADLERELLRKAATAMRNGCTHCADCGRVPLHGEHLHVYARGARVCDLCRPLRREHPQRTEPVRHTPAGLTVRVFAKVA